MLWTGIYLVYAGVMFLATVSLHLHTLCTALPTMSCVSNLIGDSKFFGEPEVQDVSAKMKQLRIVDSSEYRSRSHIFIASE